MVRGALRADTVFTARRREGKVLGRARRAPPVADKAKARPEQRSKSRDALAEQCDFGNRNPGRRLAKVRAAS